MLGIVVVLGCCYDSDFDLLHFHIQLTNEFCLASATPPSAGEYRLLTSILGYLALWPWRGGERYRDLGFCPQSSDPQKFQEAAQKFNLSERRQYKTSLEFMNWRPNTFKLCPLAIRENMFYKTFDVSLLPLAHGARAP